MMESTGTTGKEGESVGDSTTTSTDEGVSSHRLSAIVLAETMSLLEEEDSIIDEADHTNAPKPKPKPPEAKTKPIKPKKTSTSTSSRTGEAVSVERKEQLLLEARVNRLQWIHQVPLPYRKAESPDDPWVQEKGLASFLKTCHAAALMPSMVRLLSHLYGMEDQRTSPEDVANRIETLVSTC
jgi:hypothetical protein